MSGVLNDCDALLQGASVRVLNPANAWINLATSAPGFHLNAAGVADLAVVTVTADLIGLDEAVAFSAVGGALSNANGKSVDVTYSGSTAIVTATVVSGGEEFKRSCVIPVLRDGAAGAAGQVSYTWIKYADTAAGAGLSDDPAGKAYIGLAYNKSTATESTAPGDYAWSQLKGGDGVAGAKGADGVTYYTWIKYADQADGTGLYDAPNANTLYIGIAVNRTTAAESATKTDYVWSRFKGEQGVAGAPTYTWIKYADSAAGAGLSDDPTGKPYIGFAYNKSTATESTIATDYTWALIKGTDGQAGGKGADGATLYTWIKYSDVADGTGLYDLPTASTLFIGIATNKSTATESTVKTDYVWSKFKGDQGVQGPTTYTWVKYADSAAGAGLSDDPTGKAYIGFAYNKATASESTTATDYTWSLIKGTDGQAGGKGADGATLYTWIKYSDVADGTGLYDLPTASTQYLGIAVNKSTATESTVKTDYVWSKFRGADGVGTAGARGAGHYYVAGSSWSDMVAQAACPGGPVTNDVVTISSGTFVMEKRWTGSAWVDNGVVINGKLIVPDSILASAIDTRGLVIRDAQGNIVISAGGLQPGFEAPGTKNSDLTASISAAKAAADAANTRIVSISANGVIDRSEKPGLILEWANIVNEVPVHQAKAVAFNLVASKNNYLTAYSVLNSYLPTGWNDTSTDTPVNRTEFNSVFADYYLKRLILLNDFAEVAKAVGDLAQKSANDAGGAAAAAQQAADAAIESITAISANGILDRSEKPELAQKWAVISGEATGLRDQADALGVSRTTYWNAYLALNNYLPVGWDNTSTDTIIDRTEFNGKFSGYFIAKEALRIAIASKIQSNAAAAQSTANNANNAVADKVSKSAANIMTGAGALISGSLTVDVNGYRTGGYGCAQTQRGWVSYNSSGVLTFQLDAAGGNPYFAGQVAGAYGTFGAVSIAAGGKLTVGQATTFGGEGVFLGYVGSVVKMSIVSGATKLLYDPSAATPLQIINPSISGQTLDQFTATISGNANGGTYPNGTAGYGYLQVNVTGGVAPITVQWVKSDGMTTGNTSGIQMSNRTGTYNEFSGTGTNSSADCGISVIVTDKVGRAIVLSHGFGVNHGTPI